MGAYKEIIRRHRESRELRERRDELEGTNINVNVNSIDTNIEQSPVPALPLTQSNLRSANFANLLSLGREVLGEVEDPVTLPTPRGRDPLAIHGTDKAQFFRGDWREAWPRDFRVQRKERSG